MQLVEIKKFDLVTTSFAVAQGIKKDHKPVIQLVRKYKSDLEEFGRVEFEMRPFETDGGTQKQEIALLNEQQTTQKSEPEKPVNGYLLVGFSV